MPASCTGTFGLVIINMPRLPSTRLSNKVLNKQICECGHALLDHVSDSELADCTADECDCCDYTPADSVSMKISDMENLQNENRISERFHKLLDTE